MLWSTPESLRERLPAVNSFGNLVITADARLDNRDELIPQLGFSDRPAGDITDSQLILAAYEKWGEQCPAKLIGAFAFAIWNTQTHTLFCARDTIGFKPFYYCHQAGRIFAFGSEIKALFRLPNVPLAINDLMVGYYLSRNFDDVALTFYNDILRLPPAHTLTVTKSGIRLQRYWELDPGQRLNLKSDDAYVEAFRDVFTTVVRTQLRSAYPVGSMLSGGLDSSAIVVAMRDLLDQHSLPLKTYSILFDGDAEADERPYIDALVAQGGLEPHFIHGNQLAPLDNIEQMLWHLDQPLHNANMFLPWQLYHDAASHGIRVMFDGGGGDKTMGDTLAQVTELFRSGRWLGALSEANGLADYYECSPWDVIYAMGVKPLAPSPVRRAHQLVRNRGRIPNGPSINRSLNPAFAGRIELAERLTELERGTPEFHLTAHDEHYSMLTLKYDSTEREWFDKITAPFGIDARLPFLDRRLAEFIIGVPWQQKTRRGKMRLLTRRAFANTWPEIIGQRPNKANMGSNFIEKLWECHTELITDTVLASDNNLDAYVNMPLVKQIINNHDLRYQKEAAIIIYEVVMLGTWLKNLTRFQIYAEGEVNCQKVMISS
jgi:asparagine synthase (glutamine-hydrolysing)